MRIALGLAVIAVAWPGALYLHQRHVTTRHVTETPCHTEDEGGNTPACSDMQFADGGTIGTTKLNGLPSWSDADHFVRTTTTSRDHPSWEDPAALALALGGLAGAAAIVAAGRRRRDQLQATATTN